MKSLLVQIAKEAGERIMAFYGDTSFSFKDDESPLTQADHAAHDFLVNALPQLRDLPVLSEEDVVPYEKRRNWNAFWMIDPLDGTKEFISGRGDFCINISLMESNTPTIGLIYAPALGELYYAAKGQGFSYNGPEHKKAQHPTAGLSRSHHSLLTEQFLQTNNISSTATIGSALKFGRLAFGQINICPRFEGSKEWDIAAGHLIVEEASGAITDLRTRTKPQYNKPSIKNNFFLACNRDMKERSWIIPEIQ